MTGQMVLTAASVLALISLVIYFLEVSAISDKDSRANDRGFSSVKRGRTGKRDPEETGKKGKPEQNDDTMYDESGYPEEERNSLEELNESEE